jgi:hypothetical protein
MLQKPLLIAILALPATAQLTLVTAGSFTHPIFAGNGTIGVCSDSFTGDVWVIDFSNSVNLHRFNLLGTLLSSHPTNICNPSMTSPNDITQDRSTGDLWLVDNDSGGKVLRFSTAGTCLGGFLLNSAYVNPVSIVHHPVSGSLFIGHTGAVANWSAAGQNLGGGFTLTFPSGSTIVSGLTYMPSTSRFLASQSSGSNIHEISPAGAILSTTSMAAYGITNIQGIDFDPVSSLLLVADNSTVTIHIFQVGSPEFQTNQPGSSLDINGVQGTGLSPASVSLALGQSGTVNATSSNLGLVWELGIGSAPLIPASQGALVLSDGQIVNLDPADPTLVLLWNYFQSPPFQNFSAPVSSSSALAASAQIVVADPVSVTGIRVSQPVRLVIQ